MRSFRQDARKGATGFDQVGHALATPRRPRPFEPATVRRPRPLDTAAFLGLAGLFLWGRTGKNVDESAALARGWRRPRATLRRRLICP